MNSERVDLLRHDDHTTPSSSALETPFEVDGNDCHGRHAVGKNKISDWEAGVSLAKAIMGAGSFALPWAFSKMGYVAGPIFMTLLLTISVYSIQLLVQCCAQLRRQQQDQDQDDRTSMSTTSMGYSYVNVAQTMFGPLGARCAYAASMSASIGVCGSYLVFIAANLESLLKSHYRNADKDESWTITQTCLIWIILPLVVLLSSVRDMKRFAFASFLGDVSVVLGMLVVVIYGMMETTSSSWGKGCVAIGSFRDMALAFGSIGYLFLVHFLIIPIESSMAYPKHFPQVASRTFGVCAVLCGGFGILGYLMFGASTEQIVLLNVQQGSFFVTLVKILLCIDFNFHVSSSDASEYCHPGRDY